MTGGSGSPLADKQSITKDPESDEDTKYRIIPIIDITDKKFPMSPYEFIRSNHMPEDFIKDHQDF